MALLDGAVNLMGPIGGEAKEKIMRFLQWPTVEGWNEIFCLAISPSMRTGTVWGAVIALDPSFASIANPCSIRTPISKRWSRFPDAITVARAIKLALKPQDKTKV